MCISRKVNGFIIETFDIFFLYEDEDILKCSYLHQCTFNARVSQGRILGLTLSLLHINDLPDDFTCNIAVYADDTTLYSMFDQGSGLW